MTTPNEEIVDDNIIDDANVDTDVSVDDEDGADSADEGEDSPEEIAEAKRVYKLLKDPKTARNLVTQLARAEGLLGDEAPTKTELKAAKASISDILKEKLGSNYEFLIPSLSEALEKILAGERDTQQQSIQQIQIDATKRESADVLSKLARETKGESRKSEARMLELMQEFQIGPGVSIEKYLRGLFAQATSARDASNQKNSKNDKIRRNANDAPSRLQSSSSGAETTRSSGTDAGVDPNKRLSVKESVELAVRQQQTQQTRRK